MRAAWLTFEDGSFLQAELEAACPESECAEAEDGREEGHGWWGGGGGGVGRGESENVRVSQAARADSEFSKTPPSHSSISFAQSI